jgi:hypothetical protein
MRESPNLGDRLRHCLWLSCSVLLLTALSLSAKAAEEVVADRTLLVEPSEGFCALDLEQPLDSVLFERMKRLQKDYNQLAGYWVDCQQLEQLRGGQTTAPQSYVLILAQRPAVGAAIEPVDLPLEDFLRLMKDHLLKQGGMEDVEEGFETGKDLLEKEGINAGETRSLGLIADDASALYIATIQGYEAYGVSQVVAIVSGVTELNGVAISVNVYDTYQGGETVEILQRRAVTIAAELVAKNPTIVQQ